MTTTEPACSGHPRCVQPFWIRMGLVAVLLVLPGFRRLLWSQSETTAGIAGTVRDPGGAPVSHALVTATEPASGLRRKAVTGPGGRYSLAQVTPGIWRIRVSAPGFAPRLSPALDVPLGQTVTADFTLKLASASTRVEVSSRPPLLDTGNPDTTTTLTSRDIANLPNPGSDMTYAAQISPGAVMNTAGSSNDFVGGQNGYGNVEFNGLPATANGYIVDGQETNDPFLNLNSGLSTNLVLGLNAVREVTVNTNSYDVSQGRYGAAQVNYVTRSGSNRFHGNLYEIWNGGILNAANFFTNANGGTRPRSTVNHFGGSLGGPIRRNRVFFFLDMEEMRIALPIVQSIVIPSSAYRLYALQQLPRGGRDVMTGALLPPQPQEAPFYQRMFALLPPATGTPLPVLGCPISADGGPAPGAVPNGNGCAIRQVQSLSSDDHEQVITLRLDQHSGEGNLLWYRYQQDTGLQAAYTDPINPLFSALSPQPMRSFAMGWTHVFTPNLINDLNPGGSWYSSIFEPGNLQKTLAAFPITLSGSGPDAPFTTIGGLDSTWPQGRRATRIEINDKLSWVHGASQLAFGLSGRRLLISDMDFSSDVTPLVTYNDLPEFTYGAAALATRSFPLSTSQPVSVNNLDLYAMETLQATSGLTVTVGVRTAWNSNPVNGHALFAGLPGSFDSISHNLNQPLSQVLVTHRSSLFASTPLIAWQPRASLAWQARPATVVRGGFGLFSTILPGSLADLVGANPPTINLFQGGLFGDAGGIAIAPGVPGSSVDATAQANHAFLGGFQQGELSCASPLASSQSCLPPVSLTALPNGRLRAPYFMQWSFGVQQALGSLGRLQVQYVGTRGVQLPWEEQVNGYQTVCPGCFAPYPFARPADARFAVVNQFNTGANSSYNGLQTSLEKTFRGGLFLRINHTWSHCLDTISNGGLLSFSAAGILTPPPGRLGRDYGNCDYDIRQNFDAFYVWPLPLHPRSSWLAALGQGWQLSGTLFLHSGLPFSVLSAPYTANGNGILQANGPIFASLAPGQPIYRHTPVAGITQPGTLQWLNPDAFVSTVDPQTGACAGGDSAQTCQSGATGRNAFRGPRFVWSDLDIGRTVALGDRLRLRLDGQFFNAFNHPNFALPTAVAGLPGHPATQVGFGALTATTSPPTGLLGVGLGGDNSPRMIALQARIEF